MADESPWDDGEVLAGEIVPYTPPGARRDRPPPRTGPESIPQEDYQRFNEHSEHDADFIKHVLRMHVAGFTIRELSRHFNIPKYVIWRWREDAVKARGALDPATIAQARGELALELEMASGEAWRVIRENPGTKLALDGVNAVSNLGRHRAALGGLNAPIVAQVDVRTADEQDEALRGLIASARTRADQELARIDEQFREGQS